MLVALQLVGVPATPLNFTVLVPCVVPKFAPVIVTDVPTGPDVGLMLVMLGDGVIVKVTLATKLVEYPLATAMAFTVDVLLTIKLVEYVADDVVGCEPSVV